MPAGGSAAMHSRDPLSSNDLWARGCLGERAVCRALGGLGFAGYRHVDDRRWPRSAYANVDHILVGPTGVFVVDAKNWNGRLEVRGHSLYQNDQCRDDKVVKLSRLAIAVDELLATTHYPLLRAVPVICFADQAPEDQPALGRILLSDIRTLHDIVTRRARILSPADIDAVFGILTEALPPYDIDDAAIDALFKLDEDRLTGLRAALLKPIEDWTIYLHPEQTHLVRRSYSGPARFSGPAGTGKTSVGLHRVSWLAGTRPGRFLWVSLVTSLSPSMREAYRRLSPETVGRVEFNHIHAIATDILRSRGIKYALDGPRIRDAFRAAWLRVGVPGGLPESGCSQEYYKEEVEAVIKGRGIASLDEYRSTPRVGRRVAFTGGRRAIVWELARAYNDELAKRHIVDFNDVVLMARDELRRHPEPRYEGIVADEVQDLTLVGVQLLQLLIEGGADKPDGLLLIGDGQQSIYVSGWSLAEAGIAVSGRAAVLKHNHRNTAEIVAAAGAFLLDDPFDDLDDHEHTARRNVEVSRHGEVVFEGTFADVLTHDASLSAQLGSTLEQGAVRPGDIAVLLPTNTLCAAYAALINRGGIATIDLKDWDGTPQPAVKVGTYHRSKGLEFKHVYLPRLEQKTSDLSGQTDEDACREKAQLARRLLFVAASRARDFLWLGRVG